MMARMPKQILALDPGPEKTGWCYYDGKIPFMCGHDDNRDIVGFMSRSGPVVEPAWLVYEDIESSYGMPAGKILCKTLKWIGRFIQRYDDDEHVFGLTQTEVRLHLCKTALSKNANVDFALYDRFGGKDIAVGGKRCPACKGKGWRGRGRSVCAACSGGKYLHPPGPLYGMNEHARSALAVAVTWWDQFNGKEAACPTMS